MSRHRLASILLLAAAAALAPCAARGAAVIQRGPYLQSLLGTSTMIVWTTDVSCVGAVRWTGPDGVPHDVGGPPRSSDHRVALAGLTPGTTYRYTVLDGATPIGEEFAFRTAPPPGTDTVKVAVAGDSGSGTDDEVAVAAVIEKMAPDIFVHTGDIDYLWEPDVTIFAPFRRILPRACFYPCMGNDHDPTNDWAGLFALPFDGARGENEIYYSFDWGSAHFVALDTELDFTEGSVQRAWAEKDLAAARERKVPWIIVYFHRAPYTVGMYASGVRLEKTLAIRAAFTPVLDRFGVDLVLNGHDHNYQRSWPVREGKVRRTWQEPRYGAPGAPVYVVSGAGGKNLYKEATDSDHSFSRIFVKRFHAVELTISPESIESRAIADDGEVIDSFAIEKRDRPLRFIRGDADESGEVNVHDAIVVLGHLFLGGALDCPLRCKTDASDSPLMVSDAVAILAYLFIGGPPPAPPFPACDAAAGFDDAACLAPACGE